MTKATFELETFHTRKSAEENIDINNYILFAQDKLNEDSRKRFLRSPIINLREKMKSILDQNYNLYEILPPDCPIKPYFDCEMECDGLDEDESADKINDFIDFLKDEIKEVFNVKLYTGDFAVLDSCRNCKLSYHIIINKKYVLKMLMNIRYLFCIFLSAI
jgi:hypothetical protein